MKTGSNHGMNGKKLKMRKPAFLPYVLLFSVYSVFSMLTPPAAGGIQGTPSIQLQPFLSGLASPVLIRHAGDLSNRLFIVEQTGIVKVLQPGSATPTDFLNVTTKRSCCGERGLLGLAFHPQFAANRRFFINYTRAGDGATVVSEFLASAANPNLAETNEKILLVVEQPFSNHNGGMIEFGSDGFLYIAMGDGGSGNDPGDRAQNINNLLGKMLRIDVDNPNGAIPYSSPSTNPFFGPAEGRDEIYATGLRNPWRFSFDRATGEIYAGDVGQGQREEIDIITLGGNYGWRVFEGTLCTGLGPAPCVPTAYVPPITEYNHSGGRCSVTGGYVYRGARGTLPAGSYVYGDYCTGEIFLYENGASRILLDTAFNISSFGEDQEGELYVVHLGGSITKIVNTAVRAATTVSAASFRPGPLAPGAIAAAFGVALATDTAQAQLPLPAILAGTSVSVRDSAGIERPASLFFVSPMQVNYLVPETTAAGQAEIRITGQDGIVSTGAIDIAPVAPGLFAANANGAGAAAAIVLRQRGDGSQSEEPTAEFDAAIGGFVARPIDLAPEDEQVFLILFGAGIRGRSALTGVTATAGGTPLEVLFAGPQGTFFGLDQINARLDRSLMGRGAVEVELTVDGIGANPVIVSFR